MHRLLLSHDGTTKWLRRIIYVTVFEKKVMPEQPCLCHEDSPCLASAYLVPVFFQALVLCCPVAHSPTVSILKREHTLNELFELSTLALPSLVGSTTY